MLVYAQEGIGLAERRRAFRRALLPLLTPVSLLGEDKVLGAALAAR